MIGLSDVVDTVSGAVPGDGESVHEERREETYPESAALAVEATA